MAFKIPCEQMKASGKKVEPEMARFRSGTSIAHHSIANHFTEDRMGSRNVTEQQHITWELDGGNYHLNEHVELFQGRLYSSRRTLMVAKLRHQIKNTARAILAAMPILALLGARN